ncbi:pentapeptide repeat-containing protein [Microbacterium sp. NPDC057407]|uniref:pentapeptide repeat-containing protein n=1 Tax=Microbacterium sp. NPDC057407 TaxID=3346120 RepID=UPI00366FA301
MNRVDRPAPPRIAAPDLPDELVEVEGLSAHADLLRSRIVRLDAVTDASHAALTECRVEAPVVDRLDLLGATLVDVEVEGLRAASLSGREARLRRVRITGGRIGTLDLAGAEADEVEIRGIRIDYLSLAGARVEDLHIVDCVLGTLDLPHAVLSRVRIEETRADEVDSRGMRSDGVDFRGLDAVSFLDVAALRGVTISPWQAEQLAASFAASLGIDVRA